jgi:hypothetical protein
MELAQLASAYAVDSASVPAVRFDEIQACGAAFIRWPVDLVRIAPRSLYILLEEILLVYVACRECRMS